MWVSVSVDDSVVVNPNPDFHNIMWEEMQKSKRNSTLLERLNTKEIFNKDP